MIGDDRGKYREHDDCKDRNDGCRTASAAFDDNWFGLIHACSDCGVVIDSVFPIRGCGKLRNTRESESNPGNRRAVVWSLIDVYMRSRIAKIAFAIVLLGAASNCAPHRPASPDTAEIAMSAVGATPAATATGSPVPQAPVAWRYTLPGGSELSSIVRVGDLEIAA